MARPTRLIGVQTAAPILFDIFVCFLPTIGSETEIQFSFVPVCRQSGYRAGIDCPDVDTLFMPPKGTTLCSALITRSFTSMQPALPGNRKIESPASMRHKELVHSFPAMGPVISRRNIDYIPLPAFQTRMRLPNRVNSSRSSYPATRCEDLCAPGDHGRTGTHHLYGTSPGRHKIFWAWTMHSSAPRKLPPDRPQSRAR